MYIELAMDGPKSVRASSLVAHKEKRIKFFCSIFAFVSHCAFFPLAYHGNSH
jgi:hypothetical protein